MLKIYLIRHAECFMNLELQHRIGGRSNQSPLTALGQEQSLVLGRRLKKCLPLDGVAPSCFSSTAVRARDTAFAVMQQLQIPLERLNTSEQILELDMGLWEGAVRAECYSPENLAIIRKDSWRFSPPGGESQQQVEERMLRYMTDIVLPATAPGRPALVFTHGLAIKCLLRGILGSDPAMTRRFRLDNTSITELGFLSEGLDRGWHVLRMNDTMHLSIASIESSEAESRSSGVKIGRTATLRDG